jgi:hypothetical protein
MPATDGPLPNDTRGAIAGSGYSPNVGTIPVQLGSPVSDSQGQPSAPMNVNASVISPYGSIATVFAPGYLRVAQEGTQLFYDSFDTGLDTVNRWKTPVTGNSAQAAVSEVGDTRLGTGTVANGYSVLESMPTFLQENPGFLAFATPISLEFPIVINSYRFWGLGTHPATPTALLPLTDAAGFEMTTAGKLMAVCYQGGTRVLIQDLSNTTGGSGKQPIDANSHKYFMHYRGELMYWSIDNVDNVVATLTSGALGPNVNALPIKFVAIGAATPPVSNVQLQVNAVWVGDTSRNNQQVSDGVYPWKKATITALHNSDNQVLPVSPASYGLLTGGVAQLINPLGNLDRQREAGQDQVSPLGVSLGATAFAQSFSTTVPTTGTLTTGAASGTITPLTMTGIQVGAILTVDIGGNAETVVVTVLPTASTATVVPTNGSPAAPAFLHTHTPSYIVTGFMLNQERDASGENSGASGKGTAVAAEYEYTSGGPILSTGLPSLLQYDREVAALGKVAVNAGAGYAITSTTAGNASLTPTTPSQFSTLTPGQWIRLSGSGTNEYVRVSDAYVIVASPATIPLTSPVVNSAQTLATWDVFGANGPGVNPILLTGEGLEGLILNDPSLPGFGRMWQGDPLGNARVVNFGGTSASYTYAVTATAPYATPTDWIVIRGSATKTIKILRVELSGSATAATEVTLTLNKHTVANTVGTSTTPTPMQHDSADGVATATVLLYSVAPTISGTATIWKTVRMTLNVTPAATTVATDRYVYDYGAPPYEPLVLRGAAQEFAINFAGVAVPAGGVYDVAIIWSES